MMIQDQLPVTIEGLEEYQAKLLSASPSWLKALRQRSVAQFSQLDMPTVKDEEFKYTALTDLTQKEFKLARHHIMDNSKRLWDFADKADINIVLVNGVLSEELTNLKGLPKGLTVMSFIQAANKFSLEVEATITKLTANDTKSLLCLNHALFIDGVFVKVDDKAVVEPLVHIIHVTAGVKEDAVLFPRALFHIGTAAHVSIMESHISFEGTPYWSNPVTDMRIGPDANVQYCKAEGEGAGTIHTGTTRIWQERGSHLDQFSLIQGAKIVRNNLSILLKGEGCNTIMNAFYALDGAQHLDNHTLLDIQQPNCTSYQLYKGILNDASRVVFNGKIYVHPLAQKTNGYQLNKHLLLGKEARIDTKPQLEIFADDVKCTHGATIGQLNQDEIFYFQSRCITKELGIQLLSRGFIDDIINTIKNDSVRNKLNNLLSVKFPAVKL